MTTPELGRYGVWRNRDGLSGPLAATLEQLGYGAIWIGGSPSADLSIVDELLESTDRIAVATGIVNIWTADAPEIAESFKRIEYRWPGRFLLGVGVGHPEAQGDYSKPYEAMVHYLDELDRGDVPVSQRALAALGPKVLQLAADRSAGAHPYLVTPEHTRRARDILGPDALLAPEQKAVMLTDPAAARALGRPAVEKPYLGLSNYRRNLRTLGFTDQDMADGGSDELIDALVVRGDPAAVAAGLSAHLDAGANHVCVQLLTEDDDRDLVEGYTRLAEALPR